MVVAGTGKRRTPRWARHQLVAAYLALIFSAAMFFVVGLGWQPFGRPVDFGILPSALLVMSLYVIFGLNVLALLRGTDDPNAGGTGEDAQEEEPGGTR